MTCRHQGLPIRRRGEQRPGDDDTLEQGAIAAQLYCYRCRGHMGARQLGDPQTAILICTSCGWKGAILFLKLRANTEPEPDEDSGRIGDRVDALTGAVDRLERRVKGLSQRLGTTGQTGMSGQIAELRRRLSDAPPEPVLQAYRELHRVAEAISEGPAGAGFYHPLSALRKLGVKPPPPPWLASTPPSAQPPEPSHAELIQLWRRLSGPDAYDVQNPGALANVALTARAGAASLSERLIAHQRRYAPLMRLLEVTTMQERSEIAAALRIVNRKPESPARLVADMLDALDKEHNDALR